jgi:hypothetical protein
MAQIKTEGLLKGRQTAKAFDPTLQICCDGYKKKFMGA